MSDDSLEAKRRLVAAIEEERRRIGEEIHDTICQTLTGMTMLVERIGRAVETDGPVPRDAIEALQAVVENAITEARTLARRFNAEDLAGAGLMTTLQELAREKNAEFICEKPVFADVAERALALYRIAEGAVSTGAEMALEEKGSFLVLTIRATTENWREESRWSLEVMRARAAVVGGTLEVEESDTGAIVICKIPLR